jgi:hypothetical protein
MKKGDKKGKAPREGKKPFFARLLEAQELEQVAGGKCGGGEPTTRKFPSDNEEGGGPIFTTQKFPSDDDEGGKY